MGGRELSSPTATPDRVAASRDLAIVDLPLDQLLVHAEAVRAERGLPAAIAMYRVWLTQTAQANRHLALFNLGSLLQASDDHAGAITAYQQCLQLDPYFAQAVINLGLIHERLGHTDNALKLWASLTGDAYLSQNISNELLTIALNHIGRVHEQSRRYGLALRALEHSLAINPQQPNVIQHWVHIRQKACLWPVYAPLPGISKSTLLQYTSPLAMLAHADDPAQQLLTSQSFVTRTYTQEEAWLYRDQGRRYRHERVRIGYVSGDLCVHAVGLLLAGLFEAHDRTRVELYAYDFSPEDGTAHRARLRQAFDHWRSIHQHSDRDVAQQVLADEIDVLIDLHGLSSGARPGIFALHPAPLQGTYLGFIGTTAMPWFDFVISDPVALPEELAPHFREPPLYLDTSFIPLVADAVPETPRHKRDFGFAEDAFVMAAFGNIYKINPSLFDCWLGILRRAPRAVLWLIDDNPAATAHLRAYAQAAGADLSRIVFSPRTSLAEYRERLSAADLFLDTTPYNCGSTTNDVLQAGTPVLTVRGKTMVARMGSSLLHSLGLDELIASDLTDYENKAVAYATGAAALPIVQHSVEQIAARTVTLVRSLERELIARLEAHGD